MDFSGLKFRWFARSALFKIAPRGIILAEMPRRIRRSVDAPSHNNTVKLTNALHDRVIKAMAAEGFTVWSEFCRVALAEKCARIEQQLRTRDAQEYTRRYGREAT